MISAMTRLERIIFLSLIGFLMVGVALRFWTRNNNHVHWQVQAAPIEISTAAVVPVSSSEILLATPHHRRARKTHADRADRMDRMVPLNLNRASAEDLESLPYIGKITAARIVEYRRAHGAFKEKSDLLKVPGFHLSTYKKIESYLELSPQ